MIHCFNMSLQTEYNLSSESLFALPLSVHLSWYLVSTDCLDMSTHFLKGPIY